MNNQYAPIARIALRWICGAGASYGFFNEADSEMLLADPDIILIVSTLIGVAVEYFYIRAKNTGGTT